MPSFSLSVSQPNLHFASPDQAIRPAEAPSPKIVHTPKTFRQGVSLRSLTPSHLSQPPPFLTRAKVGLIYQSPELCEDGTGGTYFLKDTRGHSVAVFKPSDECPLSLGNPKRHTNANGFHFRGIRASEGFLREIFAYQIDRGFAGVPETHLAEVSHWVFPDTHGHQLHSDRIIRKKKGSLQKFVEDVQCSSEDLGSGKFSILDVQRIAVLDLLLANCDRNGGNILVKKNSFQLVPIDHAFCLPDYFHLNDLLWFEWLTWRQSKAAVLPEIRDFVANFDVNEAVRLARALGIREECIVTLRLCHIFLSEGLCSGLTLHQVGKLMCSPNGQPSVLQKLVEASYYETLHEGANLLNRFADQVALHFLFYSL